MGWRDEQEEHKRFLGHCMTLQWWLYVITHLTKPAECTMPRMNPNVNYGLWLMICQCRLIDCNKYRSLVGDADKGRDMRVWGQV